MKKFIFIFSVLTCALFSFNAFAAENIITTNARQNGNEIILALDISADSKLCTTEIYIDFPSDAVEFKEDSEAVGSAAAELSPYITANEISNGRLKISYTCTDALTEGGELLTLRFKPKKDATVQFAPEIDHAETFDGEHIRSLKLEITACTVQAEKPFPIAAVTVGAVAVFAVTAVVISIQRKRKV